MIDANIHTKQRGYIVHRYDKDTKLRVTIPNSYQARCGECNANLFKVKSLVINHKQIVLTRECFDCALGEEYEAVKKTIEHGMYRKCFDD